MVAFENIKQGCLIVDSKGSVIGEVKGTCTIGGRYVWYVVRNKLLKASYNWLIKYYYFVKHRKND